MDQKKIDRINELAKKAKSDEGLSPEETAEREVLRRDYIDSFKRNVKSHLEQVHIVDEDGNKTKLKRKG